MHNTALTPRPNTLRRSGISSIPACLLHFARTAIFSPESAVAHPELPRRTVVMLMEPARKRVNDQARLSGGGGNRNEKEQHYESSEPAYSLCFEDQPVPERS